MTNTPSAHEVNFDGLVGPTHNYAGLSYGNLASQQSKRTASNPRAAALEGLAKMKMLADLGLRQAVLPPQERPNLRALRRLGLAGGFRVTKSLCSRSLAQALEYAHQRHPLLLASCYSASSMWAANAATVSPGVDDCDLGRVHFTPANLISQFHRSLEAPATSAILRAIFPDENHFAHHPPLPAAFGDEGAANHVRLAPRHGQKGIELFVYGRSAFDPTLPKPSLYPPRQTVEASAAIARLHRLNPRNVVIIQQNPAAIDAGVFHNDVIAVGNENVFLYHESAFSHPARTMEDLAIRFDDLGGGPLVRVEVSEAQVPLADAVSSYLFNSQLLTLPDATMMLLAPSECRELPSTRRFLDELPTLGTPIQQVRYVEVRQSMRNGGGPACLRLRVVLTDSELEKTLPSIFLTSDLYPRLTAWVERHYRDQLAPDDLADPRLIQESHSALDELTGILGLGLIYPFQRA